MCSVNETRTSWVIKTHRSFLLYIFVYSGILHDVQWLILFGMPLEMVLRNGEDRRSFVGIRSWRVVGKTGKNHELNPPHPLPSTPARPVVHLLEIRSTDLRNAQQSL